MSGESQPAREILQAGLGELALNTTPTQRDALLALAELLQSWAKRINLTGHRTVSSIIERLVLDAAALSTCLPSVPSLADIGSGAGFPGLPLAILRPECAVILVESRERRHHFQRAAIRALELPNAEARLGRAEVIQPSPAAVAIAQAVAEPARVLPLLLRWTLPGGLVALPGGEQPAQLPNDPQVHFGPCVCYAVPCGGPSRTLWLGRRVS